MNEIDFFVHRSVSFIFFFFFIRCHEKGLDTGFDNKVIQITQPNAITYKLIHWHLNRKIKFKSMHAIGMNFLLVKFIILHKLRWQLLSKALLLTIVSKKISVCFGVSLRKYSINEKVDHIFKGFTDAATSFKIYTKSNDVIRLFCKITLKKTFVYT
jgi:hypothetical protein